MSTLRLYEIADIYLQALEDLAGIDDAQAVADTLEGLAGTFEQKAVNVAAYIRSLEAEAGAIADAAQRLDQRRQALTKQAGRLRDYLQQQMERTGMLKLKGVYVTLRVQPNPPSVVVEDEARLPACYKERETIVKVLRGEIAKALKAGTPVPGARLQPSSRLVIQ